MTERERILAMIDRRITETENYQKGINTLSALKSEIESEVARDPTNAQT